MLEVRKQGLNEYGLWLVGNLDLGGLLFENFMFNTNLKEEIKDVSQPIKIKRVKIYKSMKTNNLSFTVEF